MFFLVKSALGKNVMNALALTQNKAATDKSFPSESKDIAYIHPECPNEAVVWYGHVSIHKKMMNCNLRTESKLLNRYGRADYRYFYSHVLWYTVSACDHAVCYWRHIVR